MKNCWPAAAIYDCVADPNLLLLHYYFLLQIRGESLWINMTIPYALTRQSVWAV